MAIQSELGDAGFDVFDQWSRGGSSYDEKGTRTAWKSIKPGKGVTIGTLYGMATDGGWIPPKSGDQASAIKPDPVKLRRVQVEADKRAKTERKKQTAAAEVARQIYARAVTVGVHPYLERKGVRAVAALREIGSDVAVDLRAFGPLIRRDAGPLLLVPVWDENEHIMTLEAIDPEGCKGFMAGGKKSGGFFRVGNIPGADDPVFLVEGLATGLSVFEATGAAVFVAFDAGNLGKAAEVICRKYPDIKLCVAGDLDESETGQKKAKGVAESKRGRVALPDFSDVVGREWGDWNDLHQAVGLDVVRSQLSEREPVRDPVLVDAVCASGSERLGPDSAAGFRFKSPYSVNDSGVWYVDPDPGADGQRLWICSPLLVIAKTRDIDSKNWGVLVRLTDPEKHDHELVLPAERFAGDGRDVREELLRLGLKISPNKRAREHLIIYLQTAEPGELRRCVDKTGWTKGGAFVLPDTAIGGDDKDRVLYQGADIRGCATMGTLEGWQDAARWCVGNSRLLLSVSMAFAGPLLDLANLEGGGINWRGSSGTGKSTCLDAAISVYGNPADRHQWRGTANGLEGVALAHNDRLLVLDEIGQGNAHEAGDAAYMLANGAEKLRGARLGGVREPRHFRALFLSSGELSLSDLMREAGKKTRPGQDVRLLDIPVDTGTHGAFETLHDHADGDHFAKALKSAFSINYGHPFRAYLEKLTKAVKDDPEDLKAWIEFKFNEIKGQIPHSESRASGQVLRAARRFAIIAAGGEQASRFEIVPWPEGEATKAAHKCFKEWLAGRGSTGNLEPVQMIEQVRGYLDKHGESQFTPWHCDKCKGSGKIEVSRKHDEVTDTWSPEMQNCYDCNGKGYNTKHKTINRSGYVKREPEQERTLYYITTTAWKTEVCKGFDGAEVGRLLVDRGILIPDKHGKLYQTQKPKAATGSSKFYVVNYDSDGWTA